VPNSNLIQLWFGCAANIKGYVEAIVADASGLIGEKSRSAKDAGSRYSAI